MPTNSIADNNLFIIWKAPLRERETTSTDTGYSIFKIPLPLWEAVLWIRIPIQSDSEHFVQVRSESGITILIDLRLNPLFLR
jgi:hypothetical protein